MPSRKCTCNLTDLFRPIVPKISQKLVELFHIDKNALFILFKVQYFRKILISDKNAWFKSMLLRN